MLKDIVPPPPPTPTLYGMLPDKLVCHYRLYKKMNGPVDYASKTKASVECSTTMNDPVDMQ
jgi:hypothetical protein